MHCVCQWNAWYLKSGMMTTGVEEYLLWHWFGNVCTYRNVTAWFQILAGDAQAKLAFCIYSAYSIYFLLIRF